jgi:hypothetical protein
MKTAIPWIAVREPVKWLEPDLIGTLKEVQSERKETSMLSLDPIFLTEIARLLQNSRRRSQI